MEVLLDEVCAYINNWFVAKPDGIYRGKVTIEDGTFSADFLQNNQYFRIVGSVFNDGVYKYPASDLVDETFTGEVWAMTVPPAVLALLNDIEEWNSHYGTLDSVNMSPFTSESFNNYSYSKGSRSGNESSGNSSTPIGWRDVYGNRLRRWRKI